MEASTRVSASNRPAKKGRSEPLRGREHARQWLTEPRYAEYAPQVAEHIAAGKWKELDDVFWTVIPFGTGGRRGRMYPIGCNAINDRTIGESAQGLADYVLAVRGQGSGLAKADKFKVQRQSSMFGKWPWRLVGWFSNRLILEP